MFNICAGMYGGVQPPVIEDVATASHVTPRLPRLFMVLSKVMFVSMLCKLLLDLIVHSFVVHKRVCSAFEACFESCF
jgi:hypothetical protein